MSTVHEAAKSYCAFPMRRNELIKRLVTPCAAVGQKATLGAAVVQRFATLDHGACAALQARGGRSVTQGTRLATEERHAAAARDMTLAVRSPRDIVRPGRVFWCALRYPSDRACPLRSPAGKETLEGGVATGQGAKSNTGRRVETSSPS